jgi:hypothetical protein
MTEQQFKLREGAVAWQEIDGETILLDLEASMYLGTNPSGSVLWSELAAGTTRQALVARLCENFDVAEERAGQDVDEFLRSCGERGYFES